MLRKDGEWELAPAYDLSVSYEPTKQWVSQQTLSIRGKRTHITTQDLLHIAKENNIKKGKQIIAQVTETVKQWNTYATAAGVRTNLKKRIDQVLNVHTFTNAHA